MTCPLPFRKGFAAHRVLALLLLSPVLLRAELPDTGPVAQTGPDEWMTPVNQRLTPVGRFVSLPGFRPQALALSPNGRLLVTTGKKSELLVLNAASGQILQHVALPSGVWIDLDHAVRALADPAWLPTALCRRARCCRDVIIRVRDTGCRLTGSAAC